LATIFEVSIDRILGRQSTVEPIEHKPEPLQPKAEPVSQMLGTCVKCGKVVYENNVGRRMSKEYHVRHGRTHHLVPSKPELVCQDCVNDEYRQAEETENIRKSEASQQRSARRTSAYWWSGIAAGLFALIFIISIVNGYQGVGQLFGGLGIALVGSYLIFAFVFVLILNTTFINEMIVEIFSWGFVRMPGLIFTLDLDGIIWLLTVKLLFWIIGLLIAFAAGALALSLGFALSAFVFPFALYKSYHEV
jgi:hypothetical protein